MSSLGRFPSESGHGERDAVSKVREGHRIRLHRCAHMPADRRGLRVGRRRLPRGGHARQPVPLLRLVQLDRAQRPRTRWLAVTVVTPATLVRVPNKPKTPLKSFRIPEDLYRAAQAKAEERGESVSDVVRAALDRYVRRKS